MSSSAGSIFVDLLLKDANYVEGLRRSRKNTKDFTRGVSADFSGLSSFIKTAVAGFSAGALFARFIKNTVDAQNEQAQLAAVLRSTGNAAGYNIQQLNKMADALSSDSIFSPGQITNAQTRLLSYVGILGENVPRAMQVVIDQSARLGISLEQSAETIGRALEQPSKAAAALSRQGFGSYFTDETVEMLKALEKQGNMAQAQVKILEVLEESYAGAARAARNTLGGALTDLGNSFDSLLTSDGGLPQLTRAINKLSDAIKIAAQDTDLLETALIGFKATILEAYLGLNYLLSLSAKAVNPFGINDDVIKDLEDNMQRAVEAYKVLGELSIDSKDKQREIIPDPVQLGGLVLPPTDIDAQKKAAKELESIYKQNEDLIRGITKENLQYIETEKELDRLFKANKISIEQYYTALDGLDERYKKASDSANVFGVNIEEFGKSAAQNIQTAFADFLFDPFENGLKGMAKGFIDTVRRMIAEAQAAQLAKTLFGEMAGGEGQGALGGILGGIGKAVSGGLGKFFGGFFATGGFIQPGEFGVVGEGGGWEHAEVVMGGRSGATVIPQGKGGGGNVYNIDARGADPNAVVRVEQALYALAGPGVIERRVNNGMSRGEI